jgi:hypothetical protein
MLGRRGKGKGTKCARSPCLGIRQGGGTGTGTGTQTLTLTHPGRRRYPSSGLLTDSQCADANALRDRLSWQQGSREPCERQRCGGIVDGCGCRVSGCSVGPL